ncbi:MAG TPA: hypothetical protein VGI98_04585 [Candidatus Limnocylindrales bacterium]
MARRSGAGRAVLAAGLVALGLATVGLAAPQPALAAKGYHETASTTYTLDPAHDRIDVELDIAFKNTSPGTATGYYYFIDVYAWLEREATNVGVTTDHGSARASVDKRDGAYTRWDLSMAVVILYGNTRHIRVTYQIPTGTPRSSSPFRVNPAYASFCVIAMGDDGGSARVVAPTGYTFDVQGDGGTLTETTSGDRQIWSTGNLADPYAFWSCLDGPNPSAYTPDKVTSPAGREVDLEAWPDDPAWLADARTEVTSDLTKLETLVGRPLAGSGPLVVREVAGAELGAYAGFFDPQSGIAIVGEDFASDGTVAHELSHSWFNDDLFVSRWTSEGMAEWARINVVPDTCPAPGAYPGKGTADLADWQFAGPRATKTELAEVDYEYRAACYVVSTLAARIGPDGMRAALAAMLDRKLAYRSGSLVLDGRSGALTWREWLDDIDELGMVPAGVTDLDFAQQLLHDYGIDEIGAPLDKRSAARATYHALATSIGDWTLPEAVLRPMAEWRFDDATAAMADVGATADLVKQADATLAGIDAAHGPAATMLQAAKTTADLAAAQAKAQAQLDAAKAVAGAQAALAAPRGALTQVGLLGVDPGAGLPAAIDAAKAGDKDAAIAAAAGITATLVGAEQAGEQRVGFGVGLVVVLLLLGFVAIRRARHRRARLAPATAQAATELPDPDPDAPMPATAQAATEPSDLDAEAPPPAT